MQNKLLEISITAAIMAGEEILKIYNDPLSDFEIERKSDNSPLTKADKISNQIITKQLSSLDIPILSEEGRNIEFDERSKWRQLWIVDPIDGTKEFIKKNGEFTVNIALVEDNTPILGVIYTPVTRTLYYGSVGFGAYKAIVPNSFSSIENIEVLSTQLPSMTDDNNHQICRIVASRSHLSSETEEYIKSLAKGLEVSLVSIGSSLKICLVAEGSADIYPRLAPTMEWDTAAGDAILRSLNKPKALFDITTNQILCYNKQNLLNPYFVTADES